MLNKDKPNQPFQVSFKNYNEKEESTVINSLTMLKFNALKAYLLVPLLSILTIMVLPVRLYWSAELRAYYFYDKVRALEQADTMLVRGKDGNIELVDVVDKTDEVRQLGYSMDQRFVVRNSIVS